MSDNGHLSVDFVRLVQTSDHIRTTIEALRSQLDQVERDAAPLVQTWTGQAQQAYQERQATWRQASAELAEVLVAIKRGLDDSISDYRDTEKYNVGLFSGR